MHCIHPTSIAAAHAVSLGVVNLIRQHQGSYSSSHTPLGCRVVLDAAVDVGRNLRNDIDLHGVRCEPAVRKYLATRKGVIHGDPNKLRRQGAEGIEDGGAPA